MKVKKAPEGPRRYEAMFLIESGLAAKDWDTVEKELKDMIEGAGGVILSAFKWDDRKLQYEIRGVKRATYWLCYYQAPTDAEQSMRRQIKLSENILRALTLALPLDAEIPEGPEGIKSAVPQEELQRARRGRIKVKAINYKDVPVLQKFTTGQGKLYSRKRSGFTARQQRQLKTAVKRARYMCLMPYTGT